MKGKNMMHHKYLETPGMLNLLTPVQSQDVILPGISRLMTKAEKELSKTEQALF
jgi:hypothetical protein